MKKLTFILLLLGIVILSCDREFEIELSTPTITTSPVINIETTTAQSGGKIEKTGGADITAKGVCWSTTSKPTIEDNKTEDGTGDEEFTSNISGLLELTTYYLRSYATNEVGTTYGGEEVFATSCQGITYDGDLILTTQGQINSFGASCFDLITGNLIIEESDSGAILNLSPLMSLTEVLGDVKIINNTTIVNLDGLDNLDTIGGGLSIYGNMLLTDLDALGNLNSAVEYLHIGYVDFDEDSYYLTAIGNDSLLNLDGIDGITSVVGDLYIINNPQLTNVNGLNSIESIGGGLSIFENNLLSDLNGLSSVNPTVAYLHLGYHSSVEPHASFGNETLQNIEGLSGIASVVGNLFVENNPQLTSLSGLDNISSIGGDLILDNNDAITNLDGLSNEIDTLVNLDIVGNELLSDISSLSGLLSVTGGLSLSENPTLTSLDGLQNITSVGGALSIRESVLTSLDGLDNVGTIGGLYIRYNELLENIDALLNVTSSSSVKSGCGIIGNTALTSISGLQNWSTSISKIRILENPELTSIEGLNSITSISDQLRIKDNISLTNFCAISSDSYDGGIITSTMPSLYDVSGNANNPTREQLIEGDCD